MSNQNRVRHREELASLIVEQTAKLQSDKLLEILHREHIPSGEIMGLQEFFDGDRAKALIREGLINDIPTARVTSVIFK